MPKETELTPVPDGPWVFESPHVAALMDVGQVRLKQEQRAKDNGDYRFGNGFHDFIGGEPMPTEAADRAMKMAHDQDPNCWSTVMRVSLLLAQSSETPQDLKNNVRDLAAFAMAWYEDLEARSVVGR